MSVWGELMATEQHIPVPGGAELCLLRGPARAQPLPPAAAPEDEDPTVRSLLLRGERPRRAGRWRARGHNSGIKKPHASRLR